MDSPLASKEQRQGAGREHKQGAISFPIFVQQPQCIDILQVAAENGHIGTKEPQLYVAVNLFSLDPRNAVLLACRGGPRCPITPNYSTTFRLYFLERGRWLGKRANRTTAQICFG